MTVTRARWKSVLFGVLLGLIGTVATLSAGYYAAFIPDTPAAQFMFLVNEAFSGNPSAVSDREAAAIVSANLWFSDAFIPAVVGVALGSLVAIFLRLSAGSLVVAAIVFAGFNVSFRCCEVIAADLVGSVLFLFGIAGAQYLRQSLHRDSRAEQSRPKPAA